MKRFVKHLALITVLVSSLAVLQGCAGADSKQEEREPPVVSRAEESESGDPSDAGQVPVSALPPEEDEDLIREILLLYGATYEEPDESRMKPQIVSLYYADAWTEPEGLPPGAYFSWFLTTVWAEELTDQELEERYTLPDREGWAFPQEIYEARVQSRFDVSTGYLRSDEALYHPEEGVYWLGSGGGIGARPFVELQSVRREDDLLLLELILEYGEEFERDEAWQLAIGLEEDGDWKYRSWVRTDHAEIETGAERVAAEEEQARQQPVSNESADSNTQPGSSTGGGSTSQPNSNSEGGGSQAIMEEPTSGNGREEADRAGGVWVSEWEGWVYQSKSGKYIRIHKNGGDSILDREEEIAIAQNYLK